jgi:hypothetical protein
MTLLGYATRTGLAEVAVQGTAGAGYIDIDILGSACQHEGRGEEFCSLKDERAAAKGPSCSQKAHGETVLVRRPHLRIDQAPLEQEIEDWEDGAHIMRSQASMIVLSETTTARLGFFSTNRAEEYAYYGEKSPHLSEDRRAQGRRRSVWSISLIWSIRSVWLAEPDN